jgi:predicted O-methyltransferase YrrM
VRAIEQFAPDSLDFVLVDGRLRHCCVMAALDQVRTGGLLIVDDAQQYLPSDSRAPGAARGLRDEWRPAAAHLARWRRIWASDGVSDTALFVKVDCDQAGG